MRDPALARAVPVAVGLIVVAAGALQFTAWKAYHLACCRTVPPPEQRLPAGAAGAWRHGVRLGRHCTCSSAGLTALLFAAGIMDLRAMAAVTAAITVERLAPAGERIARTTGAALAAAGVCLTLRAA
jgi:predicted metal-binding membrane protein